MSNRPDVLAVEARCQQCGRAVASPTTGLIPGDCYICGGQMVATKGAWSMSTPEPPAPTPSATTPPTPRAGCASDMRQRIADMQRSLDEYEPNGMSSTRYIRLHTLAGNILNSFAFEVGARGPVPPASAPAAPTGEEAETLKALRDAADILRRYSCRPLADDLDAAAARLTAQATELAALRAREIKLHNLLSTVRDALGVMDAEYQEKVQEDIDAELAALTRQEDTAR